MDEIILIVNRPMIKLERTNILSSLSRHRGITLFTLFHITKNQPEMN